MLKAVFKSETVGDIVNVKAASSGFVVVLVMAYFSVPPSATPPVTSFSVTALAVVSPVAPVGTVVTVAAGLTAGAVGS